ncbi:MAG: pyridoxamine 5'-phosphate oxidase family protein [Chlamydiales bacterium]|nr:pyridoxamine 5'-phosphate oxidase family protein [Chlamydiales bacterium]
MELCPDNISLLFKEKFNFPANLLFGVVATQGMRVNCRTMRIYDLDEQGRIILLTYTGTKKWEEMLKHPTVSICMVSDDKLTQLIASGNVVLETKRKAPEKAEYYWEQIREDVRINYDPADPPLKAPEKVPETSGIVTLHPDFWESLELAVPYTASRRVQYRLTPEGWTKEEARLG